MLSLLLLWAVLGLVFFVVGVPWLYLFNLDTTLDRAEDRIFVAIWLGIVLMANLLLLASIFTPVNLYTMALIFAVQALPSASLKCGPIVRGVELRWWRSFWMVAFTILIAISSALCINLFEDTGLYHQQMVKWLSEYGSVTGMALVHDRFGFTSTWFALSAPLRTGVLMDHLLMGLNGFIFLLMTLYAIVCLGRVSGRKASLADWFFVFAFAATCKFFFFDMIYSLSPDLPVIFLVLIVAWLLIVIESQVNPMASLGWRWPGVAVAMLGVGAFSMKLSALPLLVVAVGYYVFARGFTRHRLVMAAILAGSALAIVMGVTTITSGCLLYPAPYLCTDLPWSLGNEQAKAVSESILEFARWLGPPPPDASNINWLWHEAPNRNYFNDKQLMLGLLIASALGGIWIYLKRKRLGERMSLYTLAIALVGIGFVLVKAPHLRFSLGFFLIIPALVCGSLLNDWTKSKYGGVVYNYRSVWILVGAYLLIWPFIASYKQHFLYDAPLATALKTIVSYPEKWIFMPREFVYPAGPAVSKGNNFVYFHPLDPGNKFLHVCRGAPLPCAQTEIRADVWLRDEQAGLSKGFIRKP